MTESLPNELDDVSKQSRWNHVPVMSPRIWNGMLPKDLGRLIGENKYDIDRQRLPMAFMAYFCTGLPYVAIPLQKWLYSRRVEATPMVDDPLFVIGHWRSGTTLLHELLTLDERFARPNTFQCFNPLTFLLNEWWLKPITAPLLPKRRPMDNMEMGYNVAQEDEFALMSMGLPCTYRHIAFPRSPTRHLDYLHMRGIPENELRRWKDGLQLFLKLLNYKYKKRLVLKSPPHTGRIRILRELYPNAKFVHITRHPLKFIPSTFRLWRALDHSNGFQASCTDYLHDYVFSCFEKMYSGFDTDHGQLEAHELVTVKFEDLVRNPVAGVRRIYDEWQLDGFDAMEEKIQSFMSRDYQRNKFQVSDALHDEILQRTQRYRDQFGYANDTAVA